MIETQAEMTAYKLGWHEGRAYERILRDKKENKMRDPKRIEIVMRRVRELWEKHPDFRFCQLVHGITGVDDSFYIEDEDFMQLLERTERRWDEVRK